MKDAYLVQNGTRTMKETYLVQNGTIEDRDYKKGFDSIVSLGYMGYAEYEFGAVQDSLKRIRENIKDYIYIDVPVFEKPITVFCNENQIPEIRQLLTKLGNDEIRTKGVSYFKHHVNPSEYDVKWQAKHPLKEDFWWDLDNDIMFWKKNPEFETKFRDTIPIKPI